MLFLYCKGCQDSWLTWQRLKRVANDSSWGIPHSRSAKEEERALVLEVEERGLAEDNQEQKTAPSRKRTRRKSARKAWQMELELKQRMNEIERLECKLSGVRVCERPTRLEFLGWLNHLLPFHLSLIIPSGETNVHQEGKLRHVGLAGYDYKGVIPNKYGATMWRLDTDHESQASFPVEAWVEYREVFGHFPKNVDIHKLRQITWTPEELEAAGMDYRPTLPRFLSWVRGVRTRPFQLYHCRWAALDAVRQCESAEV